MAIPQAAYELTESPTAQAPSHPGPRALKGNERVGVMAILLCLLHGWGVWISLGGRQGILGDWPPLFADHGIHYHHGRIARDFLLKNGTTAGYDPSFMGGFPMSIVSDLSSTYSNIFMIVLPDRPALAYKLHVFTSVAVLPWLVALAAARWRATSGAGAVSVLLFLCCFWTNSAFYAGLGMINYLLSVPLGLVAVSGLTAYLDRGGAGRWLWATLSCSAVFLVHVTSPMLVGPAALVAYGVAATRRGRRFPVSRHLGLWAMPPLILAINAFWWFPGYLLASTRAEGQLAFAHPEPVLDRLGQIFWVETPAVAFAIGLGVVGFAVLARRESVAAAGLGGFVAAGFGWGYLAGFSRGLDPLQPGRHTYAFFAGACLAAGIGLAEVVARLRSSRNGRLDRFAMVAFLIIGLRTLGPPVVQSILVRLGGSEPFLSSRPLPRAVWLVDRVRQHIKPGERLLFEETGLAVKDETDPFFGRHYSPILPQLTGVEVIGGPYLHSTVTTNFTQFGEGKLFGVAEWSVDRFERYARLYRPTAIACWSPKARSFCRNHPELVDVLEDDGTLLLGRVLGFEGPAIRGRARVEAGPNRLVVHDAEAGPDGLVVLRYHAVPYLKADPPVAIERIFLEEDPVPFIGFRPPGGPVTIEMVLPPRRDAIP